MFNQTFYFDLTRKYVMLVGALFDDIFIQRTDAEGKEVEILKVPITYAPKDKMLARVMQDPGIARPTAVMPLPCMSFEIGQMKYDGARKLHTTGRTVVSNIVTPSSFPYQYNPVPYNIDFKAYVYAKNIEDGTKIIEQILPYFTPDWTTAVKMIPEMNILMDIPVVLHSVAYSDNYDQKFEQRRAIIWTLDLLVKGYFYGPIKEGPIIKFANTSFYIGGQEDIGLVPREETLIVSPGLTANGLPTSNALASIPPREITANSDYGYIHEVFHHWETPHS